MAVEREYLSPNEIAELLGVSPFTIRRYIKLGELKALKLLGGFRTHRDDLQRFLKAHEVNPAEEALAPEEITTPAASAAPPPPAPTASVAPVPAGSTTTAPAPSTPPAPSVASPPAPKRRAGKKRGKKT